MTIMPIPAANTRQAERGFTLIEVMVALAILAVVAVAASRASSAYLSSVDVLKTRTLAHFVAQNAAADLRIQQTWLTANSTQTINAQGRLASANERCQYFESGAKRSQYQCSAYH